MELFLQRLLLFLLIILLSRFDFTFVSILILPFAKLLLSNKLILILLLIELLKVFKNFFFYKLSFVIN